MIFSSLDQIVRRTLLERGLPIHYYAEFLYHISTGLRELSFDTLKIINTVELTLDNYFAIDLPTDFVDDIGVSIRVGQLLQPVPKKDSIVSLRNHDSSGQFQPYSVATNTGEQTFFGFNTAWLWFWNINDYGEPTGRYFGSNAGAKLNGYKVIKERRQIQLTELFTSKTAVLMYISDGQSSDNATQIDVLAIACLQAWGDWKRSPNAAIDMSPEGRSFYNQKRLLRARLDDLTDTDVKQIIRHAYQASIKN